MKGKRKQDHILMCITMVLVENHIPQRQVIAKEGSDGRVKRMIYVKI